MGDVLTVAQVGRVLGLSRIRVWQLIDQKKLKGTRVGPIWVVARTTVNMFKEARDLERARAKAKRIKKEGTS